MKINKKKVYNWIKIILLIYATIGIALYYLQENFLFHPKKLSADHIYKFDTKFEEVNVAMDDVDTMNIVKFFTETLPAKGVVLYYHGNKNNIEQYAAHTKTFTKSGYEVWMPDYPGFGKSNGIISEKKLYAQAMQVKKMADAKYGSDSIILYGKSLGTGIAANIAGRSKAKMVILETPYYSIPSLFSSYAFMYPNELMSKYKIPTYKFLQEVPYPIIIFHGTSDGVIPYRNAVKLKTVLKPTDKFITIDSAAHNNVNVQAVYFKAIDSLLK